jgi:hypothetical protein
MNWLRLDYFCYQKISSVFKMFERKLFENSSQTAVNAKTKKINFHINQNKYLII